jgi:glycosyltransferase involved in cell wall biosynthesis
VSTVSCIVPVYNMERYIGEAIESILAQIEPPFETLVVDDGSTDSTQQEIAKFADEVTYIRQSRTGVSAARNRGLQHATGDFIAFLDADDFFHPGKLRDQLSTLRRLPEIQICTAHTRYFWSEELGQREREADPRYWHPFWRKVVPGHISTWLVRRRVFEEIGYFDEALHFSEDTDWLLRCRDAGIAMIALEQCVSSRRLHSQNATVGNREQQVESLARVFARSRARREPGLHAAARG